MFKLHKLTLYLKKLIFSTKCSMCEIQLGDDEEYICLNCNEYLEKEGKFKKIENCYYSYLYSERIKKLIENYKLRNQKKLGTILAKRLKKEIENIVQLEEIDYIIPVPISENRLRERGFNQVQEVLEKAEIDFKTIERVKNTKQMYKLGSGKFRRENIKKVFRVENHDFDGKNLLIVDDILTTGSTIEEIIREINSVYTPKKISVYSFSLAAKNIERNRDVTRGIYR
ncbi:MAG: ComF family protein [Fusobacteriaceae bacterium]